MINADDRYPITIDKLDLTSDDERRAWIIKTMDAFSNVLRPRLRKWYEEVQQHARSDA